MKYTAMVFDLSQSAISLWWSLQELRVRQWMPRICSQCSWLSRGIGEVLRAASASVIRKKAITKERGKKKAKEGSSTEVLANSNLERIEQHKETENRMQFFDPERRVLFLACGDGKRAVYVVTGQ